MTKEELREKRKRANESLNDIKAILELDEMYIDELEAKIEKMKRCEICKHYSRMCGCSYHSTSVKNCKENGMKLFELKEIKEKC